MKKIFLILIIFIFFMINIKTTYSSDKSICLNEFLKPCSSLEVLNDTENVITEIEIEKLENVKKKKIKKKMVKKKFNKKEIKKNKKLTKKKNINNKPLKTASNKSNINLTFDANSSFNEFKKKVVEYGKKSDFPDINK